MRFQPSSDMPRATVEIAPFSLKSIAKASRIHRQKSTSRSRDVGLGGGRRKFTWGGNVRGCSHDFGTATQLRLVVMLSSPGRLATARNLGEGASERSSAQRTEGRVYSFVHRWSACVAREACTLQVTNFRTKKRKRYSALLFQSIDSDLLA